MSAMPSLRYFDNIRYGEYHDLEILVDPANNSLWVSQPSVARMLGWSNLDATGVRAKLKSKGFKLFLADVNSVMVKSLKPSYIKGFAGVKSISCLDTLGRPNKINAIPFDTFLMLVNWQYEEGNQVARRLAIAGLADSFSSIVLEQCGVKLSLDQRQQTLNFYLKGYHVFQDWVRDEYTRLNGVAPSPDYYRQIAVMINRFLFDRNHFNKNRKQNASDLELRRIENFQMQFMDTPYSKRGIDPLQAVKHYIDRMQTI